MKLTWIVVWMCLNTLITATKYLDKYLFVNHPHSLAGPREKTRKYPIQLIRAILEFSLQVNCLFRQYEIKFYWIFRGICYSTNIVQSVHLRSVKYKKTNKQKLDYILSNNKMNFHKERETSVGFCSYCITLCTCELPLKLASLS